MKKKIKKKPEKNVLPLSFIWNLRKKLMADGDTLLTRAENLISDGVKIQQAVQSQESGEGYYTVKCLKELLKGELIISEGTALKAVAMRSRADAEQIWVEALMKHYGNVKTYWDKTSCTLGTGEVFK